MDSNNASERLKLNKIDSYIKTIVIVVIVIKLNSMFDICKSDIFYINKLSKTV